MFVRVKKIRTNKQEHEDNEDNEDVDEDEDEDGNSSETVGSFVALALPTHLDTHRWDRSLVCVYVYACICACIR